MLGKRYFTCHKVDTGMDDIQRSSSPVLETNLTRKFAADLSLQIFLTHSPIWRLIFRIWSSKRKISSYWRLYWAQFHALLYCFVVSYSGLKYLCYLRPFISKVYTNPFVQRITILPLMMYHLPPTLPSLAAPSSPVSTCIFYQRNTQQAKSLKII